MATRTRLDSLIERLRLVYEALNEFKPRDGSVGQWYALYTEYVGLAYGLVSSPVEFPDDSNLDRMFLQAEQSLPSSMMATRNMQGLALAEKCGQLDAFVEELIDYVRPLAPDAWVHNWSGQLREIRNRRFSLETLNEVRRVEANTKEAAGDTARSELSLAFDEWGDSERSSAWGWTITALLALAAACALGAWLLISTKGESMSIAAELARLAITLPIAAIAAYAVRVGGQHRRNSQWAHITAVQLKSVRAYTDDLPIEFGVEVRRTLANAVFSSPPLLGIEVRDSPVDDLAVIIDKLADLTRASNPRS